jgi:hypothetical protein
MTHSLTTIGQASGPARAKIAPNRSQGLRSQLILTGATLSSASIENPMEQLINLEFGLNAVAFTTVRECRHPTLLLI